MKETKVPGGIQTHSDEGASNSKSTTLNTQPLLGYPYFKPNWFSTVISRYLTDVRKIHVYMI